MTMNGFRKRAWPICQKHTLVSSLLAPHYSPFYRCEFAAKKRRWERVAITTKETSNWRGRLHVISKSQAHAYDLLNACGLMYIESYKGPLELSSYVLQGLLPRLVRVVKSAATQRRFDWSTLLVSVE